MSGVSVGREPRREPGRAGALYVSETAGVRPRR
jgi:hypothetical protein